MRTSLLGLAAGDAGLADGTPVHADLLIRTDLPGQRDLRVEPDLAGRPDQSVQADLPFERPSDVRASDTLTDGPSDVAPMKLVDGAYDLPFDRLPDLLRADRYVAPELPLDLQTYEVLPIGEPCVAASTLSCTCDNGLSGTIICLPSHVYSECGCGTAALMRVRNGIIGTWTGTATAFGISWPVTFTFDSYTHYSAKSLQAGISALYYGSDDDSPLKRYDITDVQANGDANGTIVIYFSANDTNFDTLQGIQLSADSSHLKFYFMHGGAGPLTYDLQLVSP
jgi:hypothetical protein